MEHDRISSGLRDPDGNGVEVHVGASDIWRSASHR